jgi:hypothetical protein
MSVTLFILEKLIVTRFSTKWLARLLKYIKITNGCTNIGGGFRRCMGLHLR